VNEKKVSITIKLQDITGNKFIFMSMKKRLLIEVKYVLVFFIIIITFFACRRELSSDQKKIYNFIKLALE